MPKISVIMPVYNGEKYIAEAIASVRAQTLEDWELIVVNDGSTDQTVGIVEAFGDARIRLFSQSNAGEAAARNTGLAVANGDYVAFLDADDLFLPSALCSSARYLDAHHEVGAVYADGYYCDRNGKPVGKLSQYRTSNFSGNVLDSIVVSPFFGAPCSIQVRNSVLKSRNLQFDPRQKFGTDWKFFIDLARTECFGYNPEIVFKYRLHKENMTFTLSGIVKSELASVRMRVLNSDFFSRLSEKTKGMLFYHLLFDSFGNDPNKQDELLASSQFLSLSSVEQARLLRLTATHRIRFGSSKTSSEQLLARSLKANPSDRKTQMIARLNFSPRLLRLALNLRESLRRLTRREIKSPLALVES